MSTVGYLEASRAGSKIGRWPFKDGGADDDLLWAGRAALGESGSATGQIAVLWAWAQLLAQRVDAGHDCLPCRNQPCRPISYRWIVGCHSQPVNEAWRHTGTAAQQSRRQWLASASWEVLESRSPGIKQRVYDFASGKTTNPIPGLADFSAPGQPDVPSGAVTIGGNAFFPEGRSRAIEVRIVPASALPTFAKVGLAGAGAALVAWAVSRWLA